jgi:hypothetical protein
MVMPLGDGTPAKPDLLLLSKMTATTATTAIKTMAPMAIHRVGRADVDLELDAGRGRLRLGIDEISFNAQILPLCSS